MALKAGAAALSLGAPVGSPMGGYGGRKGVSTGFHDDLQVRALVLSDGVTQIGIVICDLVALDPVTLTAFRSQAAELGIPAENLVVAVTHTHSGPAYGSFLSRYLTGLGPDAKPPRFPEWEESLPGRMLEALREAGRNLVSVSLALGRASAPAGIHRRLPDANGEVRLHPNPDGVTDPEVVALQFLTADGTTVATLVNHATHPVVLCEDNLQFTADFPYYLRRKVEERFGGVTLFLNGACGNINPLRRGDFEAAAWVGETIANAAIAALEQAQPQEIGNLAGSSAEVSLPLKPMVAKAEVERYLQHARAAVELHTKPDNYEGQRRAAEVQRAEEQARRLEAGRTRLVAWGAVDGQMTAQVQALVIGGVGLVGLPGENFVELGLGLKAAAGGPLMVVGYCNRSVGYVPTRAAYPEGGYEVTSSFLAPGAGETLAGAAQALLDRVRR